MTGFLRTVGSSLRKVPDLDEALSSLGLNPLLMAGAELDCDRGTGCLLLSGSAFFGLGLTTALFSWPLSGLLGAAALALSIKMLGLRSADVPPSRNGGLESSLADGRFRAGDDGIDGLLACLAGEEAVELLPPMEPLDSRLSERHGCEERFMIRERRAGIGEFLVRVSDTDLLAPASTTRDPPRRTGERNGLATGMCEEEADFIGSRGRRAIDDCGRCLSLNAGDDVLEDSELDCFMRFGTDDFSGVAVLVPVALELLLAPAAFCAALAWF